jgi:hypothetical protein
MLAQNHYKDVWVENYGKKIFTDGNAYCYVSNLFYICRKERHQGAVSCWLNWSLLTTRKVWLFKCFQGSGKIPQTKAQNYAYALIQYYENSLLVLIYFKL